MWGRVAIGMRLYGDPKADFFSCFIRLLMDGLRPDDIVLPPAKRGTAVDSLAKVLRAFLASSADSLFMLEDDIIFQPGDLEALRQSGSEFGILSALFSARRHPFNPQVFRSIQRSKNYVTDLKGIIDVEAVPFGFCLLRRSVVQAVADRNKARLVRWGVSDECITFCEDARIVGAKIGMNADVSVGHLVPGVTVYWDRESESPSFDYDNYNK